MALPDFTMRQLLEAGVHFGHQAHRWNPKMGSYIFGTRNNIHIVDLAQSVPMLHRALQAMSDTVAKGGRILFVGTKRQAQDAIAAAAKQSAQYYVNSRWLGGTLTNWKTISASISRLRKLDEMLSSGEAGGYTKKERLTMQRERDKLDRSLGGIKDMGGVPDLLFVIDTNKEDIAIKEAQRLNIPVAAIVDTNCDPAGITYAVPGNDDASRAVSLYCDLSGESRNRWHFARAGRDGRRYRRGGKARCGTRADGAGACRSRLRAAAGSARRGRRSQEAARYFAGDREADQRSWHLPLFADRRAFTDRRAQCRRGSGSPRPRRELDQQGQGIDGGSRVSLVVMPGLVPGIHALAATPD